MMAEICNVNGQLISAEDIGLFSNRAFKYGDGIFESIRTVNGKAVFLEKHFQRFSNGLHQLKINNPFTLSDFKDEVNKSIQANKIHQGGRIRFTAYRDAEGFYTPEDNQLAYLIEFSELPDNSYSMNSEGWRIDICESVKIEINDFSNLKTLNALPYVMAGIDKQERQLDDVLLINSLGKICEGSSSNVFLIAKNTLLTPPLSHGCIDGVMRSQIIDIAQKQGLKVVQNTVDLPEMETAEEVFFTNAIQGIQWVSAFRKKRYFNTQTKDLLKELNGLSTSK